MPHLPSPTIHYFHCPLHVPYSQHPAIMFHEYHGRYLSLATCRTSSLATVEEIPDSMGTAAKQYFGVAAQPTDIKILSLVIKLRVICGDTLDWQQDCNSIRRLSAVPGRQDGRTLAAAAGQDTWRSKLACFSLERAALEGQRRGLVRYTGNNWEQADKLNPYTLRKLESFQNWATLKMSWDTFGAPSDKNKRIISEIRIRIKRWQGEAVLLSKTAAECWTWR